MDIFEMPFFFTIDWKPTIFSSSGLNYVHVGVY